jgi:iron complex outermembrane receptor protein
MLNTISIRNISTATALLLGSTLTLAQQQLEEVVVTAQKRVESLQAVPISVNVISGDLIRDSGMQNMEDLAVLVPNLNISDTPGWNTVLIRGLGSGGGTASFEQSVGMYIDGIYAARAPQFQTPFLDIERVEVLRGPQGVLFGKNSIAGAISVITAKPTEEFEAAVTSGYELKYGGYEFEGLVSGALTDELDGRLVARTAEGGPYLENQTANEDVPQSDTGVVRGILGWDPTETTHLMLKVEQSDYTENGSNFQISDRDYSAPLPPFPRSVVTVLVLDGMEVGGEDFELNNDSFQNEIERLKQDATNYTWQASQAMGEFETMYLGGFSEYTRKQYQDADFSVVDFLVLNTKEEYQQISHELRITSPSGEELTYMAGLYYLDRELKRPYNRLDVNAPVIRSSLSQMYKEDSDTWSAFTQATWNFSAAWRATLGVRYSGEEKKASSSQSINEYGSDSQPLQDPLALDTLESVFNSVNFEIQDSRSENNVDPTFNLQWDVTDSAMAYFSWANASKGGGFNESDRSGQNFEFDPESAENYELGLKSDLLDGAARINLAVFNTDFDDLQVSSFTGTSFRTGNAASATSRGVELESMLLLNENWMLGANGAYLDATYNEYIGPCSADENEWGAECVATDGVSQDLSGEHLALAPEWSTTLFAEFTRPLTGRLVFRARADAVYQDDIKFEPTPDSYLMEQANWKYNVLVAVEAADETWTVAIAGFNLSDERTSNFGGPQAAVPGSYFANTSQPLRVELSATYRFF